MYRFVSEIHNEQGSSRIPDVAFHPNGSMFAASYKENNQIRIYDSSTQSLLRTYQNPDARLDWPHGLTMTNRHIIVSNKRNCKPLLPSIFNVYRIGEPSGEPITVFKTPMKNFGEAHSFAVHNGRLLVTYCGNQKVWAVVTYRFDDETGKISGPTSILESWFTLRGSPKGLCFNEEGTKVIVTLAREPQTKPPSLIGKVLWGVMKLTPSKFEKRYIDRKKKIGNTLIGSDGMAIFDVDEDGVLSNTPVQTLSGSQFSRPENVSIAKGSCIIANATNNSVSLYNYNDDHFPDFPMQVIQHRLSFPHDGCLSPDKKMLVVSDYGIGVINGKPQWNHFLYPRSDKLTIFELQE